MKKFALIALCALALANTVTASIPTYAASPALMAAKTAKKESSSQKKMKDAAAAVQKAFDKKDLKALAKLCSYPITFSYSSGELIEIENRDQLIAMGTDQIFTKGMCDAIASTNVAKLKEVSSAGVSMGGDNGLQLYNFKGAWKVSNIYSDLSAQSEALSFTNLKEAAITIQKSFSYKDIETISKLCNYPLYISYSNGKSEEIKDSKAFIALGEDRLFTARLSTAIDQTNVDTLQAVGNAGAQMGGDSGLALYSFNGVWKINNIYQ